jgi:hypothetical protein
MCYRLDNYKTGSISHIHITNNFNILKPHVENLLLLLQTFIVRLLPFLIFTHLLDWRIQFLTWIPISLMQGWLMSKYEKIFQMISQKYVLLNRFITLIPEMASIFIHHVRFLHKIGVYVLQLLLI